ncbi:MAG: XdhC family protein [Rhodobacteraceae bacterium]|nr:XdhC family protein [Paracoccaceae bacterium]
MTNSINDIPETALGWIGQGRQVALALVVETWGSAPRPVGAMMAIGDDGAIAGSVSGGCVEGAVVIEADEALADGRMRLLDYGVSDDEAFAVGLACGGNIKVLVLPVGTGEGPDIALLERLVAIRAARQPVAWVIGTTGGTHRLADAGDAALGDVIAQRLREDRAGFEGDDFISIHNPPLKMIVIGAVHIAQALVPMARLAGWDTVLIDPRDAFATTARFPDLDIRTDWPDAAMAAIGLDARTAIVTLSHDPKIDDPAIIAALGSEAFYLGCLGSRKTHAKRVDRLTAAGLTHDQLGRIHAPVGLTIGAKTPAEIAVSILAEVTATLRQG